MLPPKPRIEFPRPVVEGRPPTLEDVTALAAYQRVIDAWIAKVNNLYFRHFGVAER